MRCRAVLLSAERAAPSCAKPLACVLLYSAMWTETGCKSSSLSNNTASNTTALSDQVSDPSSAESCVAKVSSSSGRICILRKNGEVACVGRGFKTLTTLNGRYVDLERDCVVRADDGAVACWRGRAPYVPKVRPEFGTGNVEVGDSLPQACARRKNGSVFCTRAVSFGVAASSGVFDDDAQQVVAGVNAACSFDSVGDVACWGDNVHGQLGRLPLREGIVIQWQPAAPVRGLPPNIIKLAVGLRHFCALSKTGEVWCWGTLFDERVNEMTQHPCDGVRCPDFIQPTPVRIPLPEPMTDLAGAFGMCAVSRSNEVWCWGHNSLGQVRQPVTSRALPRPDGVELELSFEPSPVRWKELGSEGVRRRAERLRPEKGRQLVVMGEQPALAVGPKARSGTIRDQATRATHGNERRLPVRCRTTLLSAVRAAPSCARPLACFVLSSVMWSGTGRKSFSLRVAY